MKRVFTLIIVTFLCFQLNGQEIDSKQRSLVMKKASTSCSICGGWGWNLFDKLVEEIPEDEAIIWVFHHSGDLQNEVANAMSQNFPTSSQPRFYVNNDDMNSNSNVEQSFNTIETVVESLNSFPSIVGIGSDVTYENGLLVARNKVELYDNTDNGDLYLATYLIEKSRVAFQSGQGSNANHINYLNASFGDSNFGTLVTSNGVSGDTYDNVLEMEVGEDFDIDNFHVATIVWFNSNGTYTFFNGKVVDIEEKTSSNIENILEDEINVYQKANTLIIEVENTDLSARSISIFEEGGKLIWDKPANSTISSEVVDVSNWKSGIYFVNIVFEQDFVNKKVVIVK